MKTIQRYRWSSREYARMGEMGLIRPDVRTELIDGEIVAMSPQGSRHFTTMRRAEKLLVAAFDAAGVACDVRVQGPLDLGPRSQPEPDVAVVPGAMEDYEAAHPTTALLVVEISNRTLHFDQTKKLAVYARAGIAEYWIVNLIENVVEVYRDPRGATYGAKQTYAAGGAIAPLAASTASVAVSDLLP